MSGRERYDVREEERECEIEKERGKTERGREGRKNNV